MEKQICKTEYRDPELDPEVAARRNKLFQQYVAPYYNMIYKLCMNYTYNPVNVPENYNGVLINFYRRIETYDPNKPIRTWLHIVTKRQIAELERKRKVHDNRNDDYDIEELCKYSDKQSSNSMGIDNYRDVYSDEILAVLDSMKPTHRDALLLQEAGFSIKEIAEIEHNKGVLKSRNTETIKSRLFLARQYLKKHLTRDGKRKID